MTNKKLSIVGFFLLLALLASVLSADLHRPVLADPAAASKLQIAEWTTQQGQALFDGSDFAGACRTWSRALELHARLSNERGKLQAYLGLGNCSFRLGEHDVAKQYGEWALEAAKGLGDRRGEAGAYRVLGIVDADLGRHTKAAGHYRKSLQAATQVGDRDLVRRAHGNLGAMHMAMGNFAEGFVQIKQSLEISLQEGNHQGSSASYGNLSFAYFQLGDRTKGIEYAKASVREAFKSGNKFTEERAYGTLGFLKRLEGDPAGALRSYKSALELALQLGDKYGVMEAQSGLGDLYADLGAYAMAASHHREALALTRQLSSKDNEAESLGTLGDAYLGLGQPEEALEHHRASVVRAVEVGAPELLHRAYARYARMLARQGESQEAVDAYFRAVQAIESVRGRLRTDAFKTGFFEDRLGVYYALIRLLIERGESERALEMSERVRARALVDLLGTLDSKLRNAARAEVQSAKVTLRSTPSVGAGSATQPEVVSPLAVALPTLQDIRRMARLQRATFVEYLVLPRTKTSSAALAVWTVSPSGVIRFHLTKLEDFERRHGLPLRQFVERTREAIGSKGDAPQALRSLWSLLITPIETALPGIPDSTVIVIPHGPLHAVPFAALIEPQTGHRFIDRHILRYAPSIHTLQYTGANLSRSNGPGRAVPLVVGDAEPPVGVRLASLPGARAESMRAGTLLGRSPLLGKRASEAAVKRLAPLANALHLAVHGVLNEQKPLESALILAEGQGEDGRLTAGEIFSMKLKARMVVLSACDTGRGLVTGEGVVGLSRAFIAAGVPSLVISQWPVEDAATATLMSVFYGRVVRGEDRGVALRKAMLQTRKLYPRPAAWAAFALIGEG